MTILHRYITALFLKYFCLVLLLVVVIYLSVDFFGRIDKFIASGRPAGQVVLYFLLKIPLIVSQITPVGVLLAVLIVFGLMNKNNEIIALKSGGVGVFYLLAPVVVMGMVFSLLLFVFSEIVVPISIARANRIEQGAADSGRAGAVRQRNIWLKPDRRIVHVKHYHPADEALSGVTVYFFDPDFNLVHRLDAASARYGGESWVFSDCLEQWFKTPGRNASAAPSPASGQAERIRHKDRMEIELGLQPADFRKMARESEEMSFTALWRYIRKAEAEGYDASKYRVDLHAKVAFPLVCLVMSLMGGGVALGGKTRDGMAVSFAYGILTAFVYWSVYSFCLSLGYGGVLPPLPAAWCANVIFFLAAGFMLVHLV